MTKYVWLALLAVPLTHCRVSPASAEEAAAATIVGVQAQPEQGRTVIRIETTSPSVNFTAFTQRKTTLVVDLYGLALGAVAENLAVASAEVRSIRVIRKTGNPLVARFEIERVAPGPSPIRQEGTAVIIEVRAAAPAAPAAAAAAEPAAEPAAELGPSAGDGSRLLASRLDGIVTETRDGALSVLLRGDGDLRFESFTLADPPRLVLDIHGVDKEFARNEIAVDHPAVRRVRVAQFRGEPDKVTRVVLDLGDVEEHRISQVSGVLRVDFGEAALRPLPVETVGAAMELSANPAEAAQGVAPQAPIATENRPAAGYDATVHGAHLEEEGTLISLDLKDADLKDVLRYFSEISGLNIILDPAVSGLVTVRLIEVPWNKALDIILKTHGFAKSLEGNILRIAETTKLARQEQDAAELIKRQYEARPLVTFTRPISYGNATEIAAVVQKTALSSKGDIIVDARTNTLVVTEVDIPEYREKILDLIKTLDMMTPQVEIEARVVETTKTYARSFGLQWGFNHRFDSTTGSTTDLMFPNSGFIQGDLVKSSAGFESSFQNGGWAVNLPAPGANGAIGFHLANISDQFQLDVALSALEDEGKGRVLSAPKITTQSNISASITSGVQIPIQTIANNTITVEYKPASLSLNVTPQVTADNTVVLKVVVNQSSVDLASAVGLAALPTITTRAASTTLIVADGGTAVIGGVFQLNEGDTQSRIPVLSKIPILGWLFKNRSERRQNNELLIFITPKIKRPIGASALSVSTTPEVR